MTALRITYVGLPLGALALAEAGFAPSVICLGHCDAPGARRVRRVLGAHSLVLGRPDLGDPGIVRALASVEADVLLSWFWPKRIPAPVLALARHGAYGVHPSLLPRWRGPDPYFWAILAGDRETGVSLHALEPEYDTGAVLAQQRLAIEPNENAWALARRLDRLGLPMLVQAAQAIARGTPWTPVPQNPDEVTLAARPDDADLVIDWSKPADAILRLVRAAAPYPGAGAELGDTWVEVLAARLAPTPLPAALKPAEAMWIGDGVAVQTGRGGLLLERVRDETGQALQGAAIRSLFPGGLTTLGSAKGRASGKNGA